MAGPPLVVGLKAPSLLLQKSLIKFLLSPALLDSLRSPGAIPGKGAHPGASGFLGTAYPGGPAYTRPLMLEGKPRSDLKSKSVCLTSPPPLPLSLPPGEGGQPSQRGEGEGKGVKGEDLGIGGAGKY